MDIVVREENPEDAATIHAVTAAAFLPVPYSDHSEQHIVDALRAAGALEISLVAEMSGTIVGHIALSPVTISDGTSAWFGLGPISVVPEHQGKGVGSTLMHKALALLRSQQANGCVLLGDPAYYGRFGFKVTDGLMFPGGPAEYFQSLHMHGEIPVGVVTYHPSFS